MPGPAQVDLGDVVASNVRAERARRRWTQRRLADELDWPAHVVTDLEAGRRRVQIADLPPLCRVFDVGIDRLLVGADPADVEALRLRF